MKNVGILTIQKSPSSYGANLQCYALWKYIKSLGYNCDVIDLIRPCHQKYRNYGKILENNFMYDKSNVISKFKNKLLHSLFRSRMYIQENSCFSSFWKEISYSKTFNLKQLYKEKKDYEIYVTGSDQVWNPTQSYKIEPYFLTFARGRKISYASSMGIKSMPENMRKIVKPWLQEYSFISVREKELLKDVSEITDGEVAHVVDPTFLLDKEEWMNVIQNSSLEIQKKEYILFYSLSYKDDFVQMLKQFCIDNCEYEIVVVDYLLDLKSANLKVINNIGPLEFLSLIYKAKYVVTDSFHCMAFSINFDIPFAVIKGISNEKRISRMESILDICNSLDRIIDANKFDREKIDFGVVDKKELNHFIDNSKIWLMKSLEVCSEYR